MTIATETTSARAPDRTAAAATRRLALTPAEVELLWAARSGDWVELLLSLWPTWGFCPRHGLGFAIVEIELEGRPFSSAIDLAHLVRSAAGVASERLRTRRGRRRLLQPRGECALCARLANRGPGATGRPPWPAIAERVNERRRLLERLDELRGIWRARACPSCIDGGGGIVCRPHVVAGGDQRDLGASLDALHERLRRLSASLTPAQVPTDAVDRLSWLEALGWLGGWADAARLLAELEAAAKRLPTGQPEVAL